MGETWTVADEIYRNMLIGAGMVMLKEKMRQAALETKSETKVPCHTSMPLLQS